MSDKKTRTPKQPESIFKGALSLPLDQRVHLMNQLQESIKLEVESLKEQYRKASEIANIES